MANTEWSEEIDLRTVVYTTWLDHSLVYLALSFYKLQVATMYFSNGMSE